MQANAAASFEPDATLAFRLAARCVRADSGCLLWTGLTNGRGYGLIKNGPKSERRMVTTHRAAFVLHVRSLEPGEHVLHRCDTPACVEPSHLFAGDHSTNMRDMIGKGRRVHEVLPDQAGALNSQTHLTDDDVVAMRTDRARGVPAAALALAYDVSRGTVYDICARRTWRHLP